MEEERHFVVVNLHIFLPWLKSHQWAKASSLCRIHDHTQTHHNR